jgi:DNA topoisomerase-1
MRIAQRLYEGIDIGGETTGLITYMRTDGVQIANEAIAQARSVIGQDYGKTYVPDVPRNYQTRAKNAQEAHEAIRPTDISRRPASLKSRLDSDQFRLYELIWMRTVASQMESAELERTTVDITAKAGGRVLELRASGQVIKFDGFLAVYQEGRDDDPEDDESRRLPAMSEGEALRRESLSVTQHFTEPPPRYSEASLVKRMEELGIGRPSTYASILQVLKDRGYVKLEKKRLSAEDKGRVVIAFLEKFFARYVEFDFTADLEEQLDRISNNEIAWKQVLADFWRDFIGAVDDIKDVKVSEVLDVLDDMLGEHIYEPRADGGDPRQCPSCGTGRLNLKAGKFGAFVGCSNYPECRFTRPFGGDPNKQSDIPPEGKLLGNNPQGEPVYLKSGRFGAYVQLGPDPIEKGEKPKRSSIPNGWSVPDLNLEQGLKLLSLPRDVGKHPEDGEMIIANLGRYGPYVKHLNTYASLPDVNELFDVGLNRAVTLIAEKRAGKGGGRGRQAVAPLREIGKHPDGEAINLFNGRYGPYLKHGTINANIPRGADPASITLEQAIELVDARAAAAPSTKMKGKRGKAPAKKAAKAPAKTAAKAPAPKEGKKAAAAKTTGDKKSTTTKTPAAKKAAAKAKTAKKATKAEA